VATGSRSYSDLLDTLADSVCIHQLVLKRRSKALSRSATGLTYGSFHDPINAHVTWWPHGMYCSICNWSSASARAMAAKTKTKHYYSAHKGEFQHVSISAQQRSLRCVQNLRGPFLRATLPMTVAQSNRHCTGSPYVPV